MKVACPGLKGPAEARDSGPRFTPGCELALQYDSREHNRNRTNRYNTKYIQSIYENSIHD